MSEEQLFLSPIAVRMRFSQALFIVSEIGGPVVEGFLSVVSGVLGVDYTVRVSTRDLGERQATGEQHL